MDAIRINFGNLQPGGADAPGGQHVQARLGRLFPQVKNRGIGHDRGPHFEKLNQKDVPDLLRFDRFCFWQELARARKK